MDFEDLFNGKYHRRDHGKRHHEDGHDRDRGKYGKFEDHEYHQRHHERGDLELERADRHHNHHDNEHLDLFLIGRRLLAQKKLLIPAAIVIVVFLGLAVILVLPWLGQAVEYIDRYGIKGVIERLWEGAAGSR